MRVSRERVIWKSASSSLLGRRNDPRAAEIVAQMLERSGGEAREDGLGRLLKDVDKPKPETWTGRTLKRAQVLWALLLPALALYAVSLLLRWQVWLLRTMLVEPLAMGAWRTRRYLADAVAVQLTRFPDGLARALPVLGAAVELPAWTEPLFVVGSRTQKRARLAGPHPPLAKRLARLAAMGATVRSDSRARGTPAGALRIALVAVGLLPVLVIAGPLVLYVVAFSFLLALAPSAFPTVLALKAIVFWCF